MIRRARAPVAWRGPLLIVAALVFAGCATDGPDHTLEEEEWAREWLAAVEMGDEAGALTLAERLAPASEGGVAAPDPSDAALFARHGLAPGFLTASFNHWDFQAWSHALFFRRLALETAAGHAADDGAGIVTLFQAVVERLEPPDPSGGEALWPYRIWQTGRGYCDRQAWVFCELAYQWGGSALIVYLRDPVTLVSPHTIAQVRFGGRVFTADPLSGVLLPDASIALLQREPERARAAWPAQPSWVAALVPATFYVPAYPQDYCPRNQRLGRLVRERLGAEAPRFGEAPGTRLPLAPEALEDQPCALWHYPLGLLAYEAPEWRAGAN